MTTEGLSNKEFLTLFASKLKSVLNPTIIGECDYSEIDQEKVCIRINTDIKTDFTDTISFSVKCLVNYNSELKTIYAIGYFDKQNGFCISNLGSYRIDMAGISDEDDGFILILAPESDSKLSVLKTEVEVFRAEKDDNKNHAIEVLYDSSDLYDLQEITSGETDNNFRFAFNTGDEIISIQNGSIIEETIQSIKVSKVAESLNKDISLTINSDYPQREIQGSGSIDKDDLTGNIDLEIDTSAIANVVKDQVLNEMPVADSEHIGGISIGNPSSFSEPQFPIILNTNHEAYVDLHNFNPSSGDVHRYSDMSLAPQNAGFIVQYIGRTNSLYTRGYFYQYTPTNFNVENPITNTKWIFSDDVTVTGQAIADYNVNVDYLINSGILNITMNTEIGQTVIEDSTMFTVSQNGAELVQMSYAELKSTFKVQRHPNAVGIEDSDFTLELTIPLGAYAWKQKNVQPMLNVGSLLVYKGTIDSYGYQDDIAALSAQVSNPELGDCYTVKPSLQEYFWAEEGVMIPHWEFMGQIIDVPTYTGSNHISIDSNHVISDSGLQETLSEGDGISITSNHDISVKYDNSTIKKNSSGNLYVDGVLTDTLADWNESDTTSPAYINHKPTIPTVNDTTVVFATLGNDSDKFAQFTLNQGSDTEITIKEGANIKLYPDLSSNQLVIEAIDTTYEDFVGSSHGLVPASASGDSTKFLKGDGTWATPSGTGLTGVSFNGTAATVTSGVAAITASVGDVNVIETVKVNGSALTPDANKAVDITVPQGTVTSVSAGVGLTTSDGNAITSSGTVKAKLRSESLVNLTAALGDTPNRQYAVELDTDGYLSVNVPWTDNNDNTTYSFSLNGNTLTITPSSGNASTYTPTFTDNDRYVNLATFADDSINNSSSPVKMTLTRAGSDSATVTANLPKVSSTTAGVVPKGDTVSTQSQSTKFLREDGSWATPSYTTDTNTTYTFAEGTTDGAFQVTPSGGSALIVDVHNVLKLSGGTLTGQVYFSTTGLHVSTSAVSYSKKYNWLNISTDTTLTIDDTTNLPSMCEVIYAIKNTETASSVVLTLPASITSVSNGEVYNMIGVNSFTIPVGKIVELVFTFWSPTVVSFNGGVSL